MSAFPLAEPNMNIAKLPAGNFENDAPAAKAALFQKLTGELADYAPKFQAAFGVDIAKTDAETTWRLVGRAIRQIYRQAVSRSSAFDRWNAGDDTAMDEKAVRGLEVFTGKGRCVASPAVIADPDHDPILDPPPSLDGDDIATLVAFVRALRGGD